MCALVPYPLDTAPSQRFRLEQWRSEFTNRGIHLDLKPFAHPALMRVLHAPRRIPRKALGLAVAVARRVVTVAAISRYDAVIVHRAAALAGPAVLERLVAMRRPLIFDFDDAIYLTNTTDANRRFGWLKFAGKTASICRISAHVVVGNRYLAEYARRYNSAVTVVPSSVDTQLYRPAARRQGGPLVIGWMGSSTSQTHLELFAPVLHQVAGSRSVEIRVVSDRPQGLRGLPVRWRPWSLDTELEELRGFDIGIMPMPDDPWAEGKCAMKALLYMAVGIPVVCSAVGVNRHLIRHGENGLLASNAEEWVRCLEQLVDSASLRARLGLAGRETVEAEYSTRKCAARFISVIHEVIGDNGASRGYR